MSGTSELVKLVAYFQEEDDDGFTNIDAENLWATPVEATPGGGTYRLTNVGLFIPFAPDDVVRAQLNAHSRLAVVGVEAISDRCVVNFMFEGDEGGDVPFQQPLDVGERAVAFARSLETHGVHVEGPPGFLTTSWPDGWGPDDFKPVAEACMLQHPGWLPSGWYTPDSREAEIVELLDVAREVQPEMATPEQAAYWAADDPGWAAIGVTDAEVLARMQMMAVTSRQVFATIQAGRHRDVLIYWERLSAPNVHELPPLDRPLLVDGDEE